MAWAVYLIAIGKYLLLLKAFPFYLPVLTLSLIRVPKLGHGLEMQAIAATAMCSSLNKFISGYQEPMSSGKINLT